MSEIFSPGSVAGPAGAPGAAGAAGSLANVKSLTDNLLPNVGNLFDCTRVLHGGIINSDGSVGPGGWDVSPPIYCAGATSAITDLPVRAGDINGAYIALYDANGNFLETLPSTYFGSSWGTVAGVLIGPGLPFPLRARRRTFGFAGLKAIKVLARPTRSTRQPASTQAHLARRRFLRRISPLVSTPSPM